MSEVTRMWLVTMFDSEIKEVDGTISNNRLWAKSCDSAEEAAMFEDNIVDLEEYKEVLMKLREQAVEGTINV